MQSNESVFTSLPLIVDVMTSCFGSLPCLPHSDGLGPEIASRKNPFSQVTLSQGI